MTGQRRWGAHRITRIGLGIPVLAAVAATVIEPEVAPAIVVALLPFIAALRIELRLDDDEVVLRRVLSTVRIPRSDVAFARFDYKPFGVFLEIHRRSGVVELLPFSPKMTSSELSGDPPPPDSVAYQISRWAEEGRPTGQ
ncbi:hypothetical protein EV137_0902 [Kribbella pratensis]|uniref:PH domain-containing protein n=1 Tax=Kribbella pratensis TaxID=2512112 RepID=A0ABY2FL35_9ACTN|nr:hypothetical protein [Kribbella pratensis]TDW93611.1 hypothetical protein EV137_0902 [Kribbella pratensis]